jgi:hypothetical protein
MKIRSRTRIHHEMTAIARSQLANATEERCEMVCRRPAEKARLGFERILEAAPIHPLSHLRFP